MKDNTQLTSSWAVVGTLPNNIRAIMTYAIGMNGIYFYVSGSDIRARIYTGSTSSLYGQVVFALE